VDTVTECVPRLAKACFRCLVVCLQTGSVAPFGDDG